MTDTTPLPVNPARQVLANRIAELRLARTGISRQLGHSHSYLQIFIALGVPAELKDRDRHKLGEILGLNPEELKGPRWKPAAPQDPVRQLLAKRIAEVGLTEAELSLQLGYNPAYLHRFISYGAPAELADRARLKLAEILQLDPDKLKGPGRKPAVPAQRRTSTTKNSAVRELLANRLAEFGLPMNQISDQIERNPTYIQQFITRGVPIELDECDRHKLAEILQLNPDELRGPGRPRKRRSAAAKDFHSNAPLGAKQESEAMQAIPKDQPFRVSFTGDAIEVTARLTDVAAADKVIRSIELQKHLLKPDKAPPETERATHNE